MKYDLVAHTPERQHPREQEVLQAIGRVFPMHDCVFLSIQVCECGAPDVHLQVQVQIAFSWWDWITYRRQYPAILQAIAKALRQPASVFVRKMPGHIHRAARKAQAIADPAHEATP